MAATYDPTLPSNLDWVRHLIGDTSVSSPRLQDEEIEALISENESINGSGLWTKYLVAAIAGVVIAAQGGDVVMKQVGDLKVEYGGDDPESGYRSYLKSLQEKGASLLLRSSGSHVLRLL